MNAPAYSLDGAPVAFRRSLRKCLANSDLSPANEGLQYKVSSLDTCLCSAFRRNGGAAGAHATHIDNMLACGERGVLSRTQTSSEARLGKLKLQESPSAYVGMELSERPISRGVWPRRISRPSGPPLKLLLPCRRFGGSCFPRMLLFVVSANRRSYVGLQLYRAQIFARALLDRPHR